MGDFKYVYGPVPSRRMGLSIGVSPIPEQTCNYSCIYCQLGRTRNMTNKREMFFDLKAILDEFKVYIKENINHDVVTIVGEGEPTLYKGLGDIIIGLKTLTTKPIAVITNGGLMYDKDVRNELLNADIVLPSLDAADEETFRKINRPLGSIKYNNMLEGLIEFSHEYKGQLWLETMIIQGINDKESDFMKMKEIIKKIKHQKLYINSPVRPPAENYVKQPSDKSLELAVKILEGISIDRLDSIGFYSEIEDDYDAILSIIKRHPMNTHEITGFLKTRDCKNIDEILLKLSEDRKVDVVSYKGYDTFRLK